MYSDFENVTHLFNYAFFVKNILVGQYKVYKSGVKMAIEAAN